MISKMKSIRSLATGGIAAGLIALTAWMMGVPAGAQPPAGGPGAAGASGGRGRGGGFRPPDAPDYNDFAGWTNLFDGKTLNGWAGNPDVWKVVDGTIFVESTPERRVATTYLIWTGNSPVSAPPEYTDFELKADVKMGGLINGGIQYRSYLMPNVGRGGAGGGSGGRGGASGGFGGGGGGGGRGPQTGVQIAADPKYNVNGYQYDFDGANRYSGNLYEQGSPRQAGEMSWRGGVVRVEQGKHAKYVGYVGDATELSGYWQINDWNQLHLIVRGNVFIQMVNGHVQTITLDDDPSVYKAKGIIALEIEAQGTCAFRNIYLKTGNGIQ